MKKPMRLLIALLAMGALASCDNSNEPSAPAEEAQAVSRSIELPPAEKAVADQNGEFAWKLFD